VWSGRWEGAAVKSIEAVVTFTRKDGTVTRPLPVTSTLRMRGDLIKDYRIFMDVSPLFAQQAYSDGPPLESLAASRGLAA